MARFVIYVLLIVGFATYSFIIYTSATEFKHANTAVDTEKIKKGKLLYQQYNCQACHQVFGLGGYLGPDLTHAISDPARGENMIIAMLKSGGSRMPDFKLKEEEIDALVNYLKHIDAAASTNKN